MTEQRDADHDHPPQQEVGTFSTGQEMEPESDERARRGDFAEGQMAGDGPAPDALEGDFAAGQEYFPEERDLERDDFARGQDRDTTIDDDTEE